MHRPELFIAERFEVESHYMADDAKLSVALNSCAAILHERAAGDVQYFAQEIDNRQVCEDYACRPKSDIMTFVRSFFDAIHERAQQQRNRRVGTAGDDHDHESHSQRQTLGGCDKLPYL